LLWKIFFPKLLETHFETFHKHAFLKCGGGVELALHPKWRLILA